MNQSVKPEKSMKPVKELNSPIKYLFTDIDDTLTFEGRLLKEAFEGLWRLHDRGIRVVPVTGRPAGWCELIARQWPVDGVIGENGGLYFRYVNRKMKRYFAVDSSTRNQNKARFDQIREEVLRRVPGAAVASDQFTRLMDLAIDFCEDVPPLGESEVLEIVEIFKKYGATPKVSSIHVNGWFGNYDKLATCRLFCMREFQLDFEKNLQEMAYVGDSPNDSPMFKAFTHSIGVANIQRFIKDMDSKPVYVTDQVGGLGFVEVVDQLSRLSRESPES